MSINCQSTQQTFPFPAEDVFGAALYSLPRAGFTISSSDPVIGRIVLSAGMSAFSYGENLALVIVPLSDSSASVTIESSLKVGINVAGAHRHVRNFETVISALSSQLQADANSQWGSARADELMEQISELSSQLRSAGDEMDPQDVFELGRLWALVYDETGESAHRSKALAAMSRACELDPELRADDDRNTDFVFDGEEACEDTGFGSLGDDPEFARFL